MQRQVREIAGPLLGLIVIWILIFALAPLSRSWDAVENVLEISTGTGLFIMCCGMTIALIGNCLDLSVGSIYALVSVVVGQLLKAGVPIPIAIAAGLGAGALCGVINGVIVSRTGIPTLIATLGTQLAFRGVADMIGAGVDMEQFGKTFDWIGTGLQVRCSAQPSPSCHSGSFSPRRGSAIRSSLKEVMPKSPVLRASRSNAISCSST